MLTHFFCKFKWTNEHVQAYDHHRVLHLHLHFHYVKVQQHNQNPIFLWHFQTLRPWVSNIRYSIIFHDLAHCDSSSEPEVESWQWRTSTGRSSKPPSFKQILVHPSLCVWTSALTIDALKIEFQSYIFNIFIYHISYMLDVDYHMHILK